jgi:hypothetical protein
MEAAMNWKAISRRLVHGATMAVLATAVAAGPSGSAEPLVAELSLTGSAAFLNGNDDQFRARHGVPPDFIGGVENLYMEWLWGEDGSIKLDGHGIVDANDYLARLRMEKPEAGYFSAGYREFRTWYDGTGGFFPQNAAIFSIFDEDLRLDRGETWFEAGLRAPDVPELTFRFTHLSRKGQKSSLVWGDTTQTGGFGVRSIVPAFWNIDETRDILNIDIAHSVRTTRVGAGFVYETSKIDNSRNLRRNPGEASDRYVTQSDETDSTLTGGHAFTTTPLLEDRLVVSTAYSFSSLNNDIGGSRIYGVAFDAPYDPVYTGRQPFDEGFLDLDGSTEIDQHVGTVTLQGRPTKDLRATAGLRIERYDISGASNFVETNVGFPPAFPSSQEPRAVKSDADKLGFTESFELRYTGIDNWVLYARGEWEQSDGDLTERELLTASATTSLERDTQIDTRGQRYVAGLTWYPVRRVNVAGRYWYRLRKYDFDHDLDSTPNAPPSTNRYPAYITDQDIETHAGDVRVTWRILDSLRATARYDIALTDYRQRSDGLANVDSARVRTHVVGGSWTWSPTAWSYLQTDVSWVKNETDNPSEQLSGGASGLIVDDFDNDYLTTSVVGGLALTDATELQGRYFYYRANDYDNVSATTQPYGADSTEHGFALTLAHRFSEHVRWRLGYAFFTNDEGLNGSADDYDASIVTSTVDFTF